MFFCVVCSCYNDFRWILFAWFVPAILGMVGAGLYFLFVPNALDTTFAYARTLLGNEGMPKLASNGLSVQMYAVENRKTVYTPFPRPALTLFFLSGFLPIQRKVSIFYPENAQLPR